MRDLGRLLRLSLAASAAADIAAGIVLGAGGWPGGAAPFLVILASSCIYHGGMALNDWADREIDARTRPERPIPSGAIPAGVALGLGLGLFVAGVLLAWSVDPQVGAILGGVALLAVVYDVRGRGPLRGPLLLALCRAGNLLAGVWLGRRLMEGPFDTIDALAVPALYGAYVFTVSRLGRLEDAEDSAPLGRRPARLLAVAAGLLLVLPVMPVPVPAEAGDGAAWYEGFLVSQRITLAALVVAAGAFGLLRLAFRAEPWTRPDVMRSMGMALRRLLIFTAAAALLRGAPAGFLVSLLVLAGYPVSYALRKLFPPS